MPDTFDPPIYPFGSKAYDRALKRTTEAISAQNRRNRYTVHMKQRGINPFKDIPVKPSKAQLKIIYAHRAWCDGLKNQTDQWWFDRIDAAIEEQFYRAYIYQLIWWDRCDDEDLDDGAWKWRWVGWDFDRALETDWDLVEYALHCCGYPPFNAHAMAFQCGDRKEWLANQKRVFKCFECDHEMTGCDRVPIKCSKCFTVGVLEELS